jgi:hypothetical protein
VKLSRQQRRAKARALAKGKDIRAEVADMYHQATAKAFDITAQEREAALKEMQSDTIGQMLVLIIAYMRIKKGHTGKWLVEFTKDFNEFCDDMMLDRVKVDDLFQMLQEETGVDFEKLLLEISATEEQRVANRKKAYA